MTPGVGDLQISIIIKKISRGLQGDASYMKNTNALDPVGSDKNML